MQHLRDIKLETYSFFWYFSFYEQLKFRARMIRALKKFITLGPVLSYNLTPGSAIMQCFKIDSTLVFYIFNKTF